MSRDAAQLAHTVVFFFSSRRRHTIFDCDWSSDVCSSDLASARGPFVIIPTLTLAEEYNDNVFLNNARRKSDYITHASPGLRVVMESPGYRLSAGYFATAEKYLNQEQLDSLFHTQGFFVETTYLVTPLVTLSLNDTLVASDFTNTSSPEGIATGRTRSVGNTLTPGVAWH